MARPQVNFRLSSDQKEKWEGYIEDSPEYDTLTDLIRVSVAHEISDSYGPIGISDSGGGSGGNVGELTDKIEQLEFKIEEFEETVSHATESMYGQTVEEQGMQAAIFSSLPTGEENAITVDEISVRLGKDRSEITGHITRIVEEMKFVKRVENLNGENTFYRVA